MVTNQIIIKKDGNHGVPDNPVIPFIEGDGIGPEISSAAKCVINAGIEAAYGKKRKILWKEFFAGEKGFNCTGSWLPEETLNAIKKYGIALKGPLTTPVGEGMRSINVQLRHSLDLYANVRPVRYIPSAPSPMKNPGSVNMVIFRENTEDLYAGIEWEAGSKDVLELIAIIKEKTGISLPEDSGIGIKPMSERKTKRLVARAISFALNNGFPSVTLMHKGNIMKFTEGAFRKWGYETAREMFAGKTLTEEELYGKYKGSCPRGMVVINDRIADNMFQEVLLKPENYHVIAAPNLNGDYLSDALAAQVGGLGIAPGANIGDNYAVFEAVHGTAPLLAGKDMANPLSLILSGVMMLEFMAWKESALIIEKAVENTMKKGRVTSDLAVQIKGATEVKCSEFAKEIINNLVSIGRDI